VADRYSHGGQEAPILRNRPPMEFIFTCCPATILRRRHSARLGESHDDDSESIGSKPIVTGDLQRDGEGDYRRQRRISVCIRAVTGLSW
jgi:hypothetical protein